MDSVTDYAKGFKDGFAAGLEEGKKIIEEQWRQDKIKEIEKTIPNPIKWPYTSPNLQIRESCPKCGIRIDRPMGYVCSSPNCPTFPQVTCGPGQPMTAMFTGQHSVVGSDTVGDYAVGANGPAGGLDYTEWHR